MSIILTGKDRIMNKHNFVKNQKEIMQHVLIMLLISSLPKYIK
jgi:hypothetical protein